MPPQEKVSTLRIMPARHPQGIPACILKPARKLRLALQGADRVFKTQYRAYTVVAAAIILFSLSTYFLVFHGSLSSDHQAWGNFGSYIGGVQGSVFGLLSLFILKDTLLSQIKASQSLQEQIQLAKNADRNQQYFEIFRDLDSRRKKVLAMSFVLIDDNRELSRLTLGEIANKYRGHINGRPDQDYESFTQYIQDHHERLSSNDGVHMESAIPSSIELDMALARLMEICIDFHAVCLSFKGSCAKEKECDTGSAARESQALTGYYAREFEPIIDFAEDVYASIYRPAYCNWLRDSYNYIAKGYIRSDPRSIQLA